MQRFFMEVKDQNCIILDKEDSNHVVKSLRMRVGENLCICDAKQTDYLCVIEKINSGEVFLKVLEKKENETEPTINLHLFQAVPKLNKLEFILQKAVELGVKKITPVLTKNCVATITDKNIDKKTKRLEKIAKQAACQSQRGILPKVLPVLNFKEAIEEIRKKDLKILFYEYAKESLNNIELKEKKEVGILIGSEGGFTEQEVLYAKEQGVLIKSLGKRILRCETAPICSISLIMYLTGNL